MGRLIDVDAEIKKIENEILQYKEKLKRFEKLQKEEPDNRYHVWDKDIEQIKRNITNAKYEIRMLEAYTTAYDVDKVVAELKAHKNNEKMATAKIFNGSHRYYRAVSVTKAINIVKGGGQG